MTLMRDLREIFHAYGFEVFEGPEIETEEYNFELLNIPPDHPSRDLWDTLYVAEPGSSRRASARGGRRHDPAHAHLAGPDPRDARLEPPIRVLTPGRCFRYEAVDASHGFEFFQVEGLVVDRDTSLADLKGLLEEVARALYGRDVRHALPAGLLPLHRAERRVRHRLPGVRRRGLPGVQAHRLDDDPRRGMVHPTVLRNGGFDPDEYQGYAFGMGPDRMTMLRPRHRRHPALLQRRPALRDRSSRRAADVRVPLSWLRDYVDIELSPRAWPRSLTMRGMEVSAIETGGRLDRRRRRPRARRPAPSERRTRCG